MVNASLPIICLIAASALHDLETSLQALRKGPNQGHTGWKSFRASSFEFEKDFITAEFIKAQFRMEITIQSEFR